MEKVNLFTRLMRGRVGTIVASLKPAIASIVVVSTTAVIPTMAVASSQDYPGSLDPNMKIQFDDPIHQKQRDFKRLELKEVPYVDQSQPSVVGEKDIFYYHVSPVTNRVGLLVDRTTALIKTPRRRINFDNASILECGPKEGYIPREGYENYESLFPGKTGYEERTSPCHIARNLEYKWFWGAQLGVPTWYSRNEEGDIQCFSIDGVNCFLAANPSSQHHITKRAKLRELNANAAKLKTYIDRFDEVVLETSNGNWVRNIELPSNVEANRIVRLKVNSAYSVNITYNGKKKKIAKGEEYALRNVYGYWVPLDANINTETGLIAAIEPLACGANHAAIYGMTGYGNPNHWCSMLLKPMQQLGSNNLQEVMDSKQAHMGRLFDQMLHWKLNKIDRENRYITRINRLSKKVNQLSADVDTGCAFSWSAVGGIACSVLKKQLKDAKKERTALLAERKAKGASAHDLVAEGRNTQLHRLHQQWARGDDTHFAALLKEESETLAELKTLKEGYDKTAKEKHQEYLTAVQQYMHDTDPGNILIDSLEDAPLIGPEVTNIVNYTENPTGKNLRHMLLGLAGPVGESVEGIVELTTEDSGMNNDELNFLKDVLTDLGQDDSVGEGLEDIVSDAINDMGDQVIDSIRQAGLWVDNPDDSGPMELDYAGIVDLRSQSQRYNYDPWSDNSEYAVLFQQNLTPENRNYLKHMSDPTSYKRGSLSDIEYAAGGSDFNDHMVAIFTHSMGENYASVARLNPAYADWTYTQVNHELYKLLADPAYYEQRIPHWVDSSVIGQRPAALLYDNDHAVIVINSDLVQAHDPDFTKFYFEELGHWLNWWRCKVFDVSVGSCEVHGDAGARFRDAVMLDPSLHEGTYETLLAELPAHEEVDRIAVKFNNDTLGNLEGWPQYYTINDHIVSGGKFSWLMRLGLDVASEYPMLSDEFDMEVSISAPSPSLKGNPWQKSAKGYCTTDQQTDCNMPTMWVSVSFRDALKLSVAKIPKVKDSKFASTGIDISPRFVRKHGGKLPFQLSSVNGVHWDYKSYHNIYYKKFTAALEAKLDLWKMGHAASGTAASKVHKPEFSLKTSPGEGSFLVEIATRDTQDFAGWLAGDIATAVAGCAGGFIAGVLTEEDPVTLCHGFSDLSEVIESSFQALDKKPTMIMEADGNVTLPVSLEYKYATSGNKIKGAFRQDSADPGTETRTAYETPYENHDVTTFKGKAGKAFEKLGARSISPIAVFRFRVGFDYAETLVSKGEYNLPSAIVSD